VSLRQKRLHWHEGKWESAALLETYESMHDPSSDPDWTPTCGGEMRIRRAGRGGGGTEEPLNQRGMSE